MLRATAGEAPYANPDHDLLLRVLRGERGERTPVWLMRQAGRYMADFRAFSNKYPFRTRSETPEIATELSLQCWRKYGMDAVVMFSDILTPLPAMGVEFDVVEGTGPVIHAPLRTGAAIAAVEALTSAGVAGAKLPFVGETLQALRRETDGRCALLGFCGAPFTLAAYCVQGGAVGAAADKHALVTKGLMFEKPALLHGLLDKLATSMGYYACYQVNGATKAAAPPCACFCVHSLSFSQVGKEKGIFLIAMPSLTVVGLLASLPHAF